MPKRINAWRRIELSLGLVTGLLVVVAACGHGGDDPGVKDTTLHQPDPIPNTSPQPAATALNCPSGTLLRFSNFGESFVHNYCTSCHGAQVQGDSRSGAPVEANFDTARNVQLWRSAMLKVAVGGSPSMPPSKNVTDADRQQFGEWLNCGAP